MKCFNLLVAILAFVSNAVLSQTPFQIFGNGTSSIPEYSLQDFDVDLNGNRTLVGILGHRGTHDFDPSTPVVELMAPDASLTGFVASYNRVGALRYAFHITDTEIPPRVSNYLVESDMTGNIYVIGNLVGKADFDPGPGVQELNAGNVALTISFLASYNANGQLRFAIPLPTMGNIEVFSFYNNNLINKVLSVDDSGNSYILLRPYAAGSYDLDPGPGTQIISYGMHVVSYDQAGAYRFSYAAPENTRDIGCNPDGNHYITGTLNESLDASFDFDPGPAIATVPDITNSSFFFAAYTAMGGFTCVRNLKGPNALPQMIEGSISGDIVIVGKMTGIVDFDPGNGIFELNVSEFEPDLAGDIFMARYDNLGKFKMATAIQDKTGKVCSESITDMDLDIQGNIYISGNMQDGTVDFDPSANSLDINGGDNGKDLFTASYSPDGLLRFAYVIAGSGIPYSSLETERACENYVLSGTIRDINGLDFNPSADEYLINSGQDVSIYVVPLNKEGLAHPGECSNISVESVANDGSNFQLYPNPVEQILYIAKLPESVIEIVQITDAFGKLIFLGPWTGDDVFSVNCTGYNPGLYYVLLFNKDRRQSLKFIKY